MNRDPYGGSLARSRHLGHRSPGDTSLHDREAPINLPFPLAGRLRPTRAATADPAKDWIFAKNMTIMMCSHWAKRMRSLRAQVRFSRRHQKGLVVVPALPKAACQILAYRL